MFQIEQWLITGYFFREGRFESSLALSTNCWIVVNYHTADVTMIGLPLLFHI
jgi:hypothetical protein